MDGVLEAIDAGRGLLQPPPGGSARDAGAGLYSLGDREFRQIQSLIHQEAGIVLGAQKRDMVLRRLSRRVKALNLDGFAAYVQVLQQGDPGERQEFRNALTTNLTAFFREAHHFAALKQHFAQHGRMRTYRIWSAACSTGEEPYSIAISALEHFTGEHPPVRILATDIDTQVLAHASAGVYPEERIERLESERKRRFFLRGQGAHEGLVRVRPSLQALIRFQSFNLMDAQYAITPGIDIVFLRNVMIYFDRDVQRHILERMRRLLREDGLLIVGHSENLFHAADLFRSLGKTVYAPARA